MNVRLWDLSLWGREEAAAADSSESALLEQLSVGT